MSKRRFGESAPIDRHIINDIETNFIGVLARAEEQGFKLVHFAVTHTMGSLPRYIGLVERPRILWPADQEES